MTNQTTEVLFNGDCPICSREIAGYKSYSDARALPIDFQELSTADMARWGLTRDMAARRLYVARDGRLYDGVAAFAVLWDQLPRFRLAARLVRLPVIRTLAAFIYDRVLAPVLYGMHKRRQARKTALGKPRARG